MEVKPMSPEMLYRHFSEYAQDHNEDCQCLSEDGSDAGTPVMECCEKMKLIKLYLQEAFPSLLRWAEEQMPQDRDISLEKCECTVLPNPPWCRHASGFNDGVYESKSTLRKLSEDVCSNIHQSEESHE